MAARTVPLDKLEQVCRERLDEIDRQIEEDSEAEVIGPLSYRDALGEYLAVQKARIGAARNRIEQRTFDNLKYELNKFGNFRIDGAPIAARMIDQIGPREFSAYAREFDSWKGSGFDSVVSRVLAFFRWAQGMEYVEKFNPGPQFQRPDKKQLRGERIEKQFSFTIPEIAALYHAANDTMQCWIALGVCAAFTNTDVSHLPKDIIAGGVIDFRRRKEGRVRRVIPLPADVVELIAGYRRPETSLPYFFVTTGGNCYSRTGAGGPSCSISTLFARLIDESGVEKIKGRGFKGLRTSFFNLAPRSGYDTERKIIMGRAQGTIDYDSYLEDIGLDRLRHVVNHVWSQVKSEINKSRPGSPSA